jgi:tetratricopeptide (TPR) repeat protein
MKKTIAGAALVAAAMSVAAADANAQTRFASNDGNVAEAARLEAKAATLYHAPKRFNEAARLHERAAELRPVGDAQQIENLRQAARLYHYAGNDAKARETMHRAADTALATGHVVAAASTYLDAAFLYRRAGMTEQMNELIRKARLLTNSPALSSQERESILVRLNAA